MGISYDEAQKELYEFWKKQQENIPALQGTFVSIRPLSQDPGGMNGVHVAIITRDELLRKFNNSTSLSFGHYLTFRSFI